MQSLSIKNVSSSYEESYSAPSPALFHRSSGPSPSSPFISSLDDEFDDEDYSNLLYDDSVLGDMEMDEMSSSNQIAGLLSSSAADPSSSYNPLSYTG